MKKRITFINLLKLSVKFAIILFVAQFALVKCCSQPVYLQPNYLNDSTIKQFLWDEKSARDSEGDGICTPFHIFTDYAQSYAKCGDVINPQLQNLMNSDSILLRLFAASTLIHMGDDSAFLKIIDYMESKDEIFKDDLDSSIGYYRFSTLKPYIPRMAKSKSPELRMWAVRLIADTNEVAAAEIINSLLPTNSDVLENNITHFLLSNPIKSCAEKYIQQIKTLDSVDYMRSIKVISLLTSKTQAAALIDYSKVESKDTEALAKQYKLYNPFLDFLLSNINKENLSSLNELCKYNKQDEINYNFTAVQKAKIINTYLKLIKKDENYLPYAWKNIYFLESKEFAKSIRQAIKSESAQIRLSLFNHADTCTFSEYSKNNKEIQSIFLDASKNSKYPDVLFNSFRYLNILDMPYDKICSQFLDKKFNSNTLSNKDFNTDILKIKNSIANNLIESENVTAKIISMFANKEIKFDRYIGFLPKQFANYFHNKQLSEDEINNMWIFGEDAIPILKQYAVSSNKTLSSAALLQIKSINEQSELYILDDEMENKDTKGYLVNPINKYKKLYAMVKDLFNAMIEGKEQTLRIIGEFHSPIAIPFLVKFLNENDIDEVNSTLEAIDSCGSEGQELVEYNITNPNLNVALESIKVIERRDSFDYNPELKDKIAKALYEKILITDDMLASDIYYELKGLNESANPYIKKLLESNNPEYIYRALICAKQSRVSLKPELILLFEKLTAIKSKTNSNSDDKQIDEWDKIYSLLCEVLSSRSYKPAQDQYYLISKEFDKNSRFNSLEVLLESGYKQAIPDFIPLLKERLDKKSYIRIRPFFNDTRIVALITSYCQENLPSDAIINFLENTNTQEVNACLESLLSNSNLTLKIKLNILYTLINRDNSFKKQSKRLCNLLAQSKNNFLSVEQIEKIINNPAEFMQDGQSPFGGMAIEEPISINLKPTNYILQERIQDLKIIESTPPPV